MCRSLAVRLLARLALAALFALTLLIPGTREAQAKTGSSVGDPLRLQVQGAPDAFYFKPRSRGMKPILMYLHGRGGNPAEDCRKWARVGTQFGWVVCPQGPGDNGGGARTWSGGDPHKMVESIVLALRDKYGRKVQRWGNVLIGFSEGAFVAMQVGLKDQRTWNRWLILAASDVYWGDPTEALDAKTRKLRRVYLLTGENDGVAQKTVRVGETLKKNKVPVKVKIVPGMGHEVPRDRMVTMYRQPLSWLVAD